LSWPRWASGAWWKLLATRWRAGRPRGAWGGCCRALRNRSCRTGCRSGSRRLCGDGRPSRSRCRGWTRFRRYGRRRRGNWRGRWHGFRCCLGGHGSSGRGSRRTDRARSYHNRTGRNSGRRGSRSGLWRWSLCRPWPCCDTTSGGRSGWAGFCSGRGCARMHGWLCL
jgi:hypothetical protein